MWDNIKVEGNIVKLPEALPRKDYRAVAKALEGIGGKWNRKANGFLFQSDPTNRLAQIQGGDKINLKKEFQFFATPAALADRLVQLAKIQTGDTILEPSAGQGAIIEAIRRSRHENSIIAIELMPDNAKILFEKNMDDVEILEADFLEVAKNHKDEYGVIIANPPFSKNQDIDHVRAMYECLRVGGRLVSIMSPHWECGKENKCVDFRAWLLSMGAEVITIEKGAFKESGTGIESRIVIIDKNLRAAENLE